MQERTVAYAMIRLCLLATITAFFLSPETIVAKKTKRKYAHGKLTVHNRIEEGAAAYLLRTIAGNRFTRRDKGGVKTSDELPWYVPADGARFADVGKVWIENLSRNRVSHCTAFYVGEDILATDAHCLTDSGITSLSDKANSHLVYFYQAFNGDAPTKDDIEQFARFVNAYWYPADYADGPCLASSESGNDWAFLRVDGKKNNAGMFTLVANIPSIGEKVLGVGYPDDAADTYKPVFAEAKIHQTTDADVQDDKGIARSKTTLSELTDMKKTMLAMIASPLPKGDLGGFLIRGASGAPILLSEEALSKKANRGKDRNVVGLLAWGPKRQKGESVAAEQPFMQYAFTPIVSDDMMQLQQLLRAKKYDDITVDEAASKLLPKDRKENAKN